MFIQGIVGICTCGREVHAEDVASINLVHEGVLYGLNHDGSHHYVMVSKETHRHAARWLRARVEHELADPSDEELMLIEFEQALDRIESPSALEALWAKS